MYTMRMFVFFYRITYTCVYKKDANKLGGGVNMKTHGKTRLNSRIKTWMYIRRSIMYERLHFVSRNWLKEK